MKSDKVFIGKKLQLLRKKAKIKQSELSEKIGISEKHLSKIETGKNYPALDNFLKMAEVLKFNLDEFGIKEETPENKYKQALLKMIYTANDEEAEYYYEMLVTLKKILHTKKIN